MKPLNQNKMTAVEWFFEQLTEVDYGCINKTFLQNDNSLAGHKLRELFDQAQAMEKEQIFKVYFHGWSNGIQGNFISQEEYYIENFKSE